MNREEFFANADHEGGLLKYLLGYGVDPSEIEDPILRQAVEIFYLQWGRHVNDVFRTIERCEPNDDL